jgi:hypothetical protein
MWGRVDGGERVPASQARLGGGAGRGGALSHSFPLLLFSHNSQEPDESGHFYNEVQRHYFNK